MENKILICLCGLIFNIIFTVIFSAIFLTAYLTPVKSVLITINKHGEADIELIIVLIGMIFSIITNLILAKIILWRKPIPKYLLDQSDPDVNEIVRGKNGTK
jgi:hypothetical protein